MDRASQGPRSSKGGRSGRNKGLPLGARKLLVQQANKRKEVLPLCSEQPMSHKIGEVQYSLEHSTSATTEQEVKTWLLSLTRENVKELYEDSGWGWDDIEKGSELWHTMSQYLIVRNSSTKELVGFTHFRFDMDYGAHVLYCYELQVSSSVQSSGIGAWLMELLHAIARSSNMAKVVLTVGRNNPRALKFYFGLGYRLDESSPATIKDTKSGTYFILCYACKSEPQDSTGSTSKKNKKQTVTNAGEGKKAKSKTKKKGNPNNSNKENSEENNAREGDQAGTREKCAVDNMEALQI